MEGVLILEDLEMIAFITNGMLIYQPINQKERVNFLNIVWAEPLISISQA